MAQSNNKKRSATAKKKNTQVSQAAQQKIKECRDEKLSLWSQIIPYLLFVGALFIVICFFNSRSSDPGIVTGAINNVLCGLFGGAALTIPVFLAFAGIAGLMDRTNDIMGLRSVFAVISAVLISVLLEIISPLGSFKITELYKNGTALKGGGVVGGLIGEACLACFKSAGSYVIVIALLLLSLLLCAGLTPKYLFVYFSYKIKQSRLKRKNEPRETKYTPANTFRDPDEIIQKGPQDEAVLSSDVSAPPVVAAEPKKRKFETDIPLDDDYPDEPKDTDGDDPFKYEESDEEKQERLNKAQFEEVMRRSRETKTKAELAAEKRLFTDDEEIIIAGNASDPETSLADSGTDIIDRLADSYLGKGEGDGNDEAVKGNGELKVSRTTISSAPQGEGKQLVVELPKPEYKYPPISLLTEDNSKKSDNIREELHDNAQKLVSVLASFNVKTKIVGVSRGPTITRYELLPEAGIRVRSIANLVDDIALNLATSGVRIEAPIPGKAAVGIEVPNKAAETVYLRSLISTDAFSQSTSKITTCLGKDVAGEPVIMDIKKMPHLLIAGATGMGKSVCINCLLVSLLYKASPDEVKLILIDPKKVEFSIYNGLPHLLVPVVSDPRKAAGSLQWAVNEMERRFGLIETVGVRDIQSYNEITKNDPEHEYMPQIVIVIDELADLMSTAPDDVETSIARLAAKARAAGMHLIIGTQRPSVDVITGVIKANIPSRIAFTVAGQVDSRTIIDRSGAENLIGRGDMLYSPVGSSKPQRVQGAFVSEKEVEAIVTYIKANNAESAAEYSDDVMKEIEAQAALCGVKKGGGSAGAGAGSGSEAGDCDPLMDKALEVAFESGKISTSLLQRRLSVGYGRAAKIIDKMEELGYVSAPEGQKPRELLITKQDYMEMSVRTTSECNETE